MKLEKPSYEILEQAPGLQGIFEQIERVGKTCYKSEVKGGERAKDFVLRMIQNEHLAMLEHGAVYLKYPKDEDFIKYFDNPYSYIHLMPDGDFAVSTNYRVLVENNWLTDIEYLCEPTEWHERRITVRFYSNIHFYKDITRHRVMSFAIESTRYCNYSSEKKFGRSISFLQPCWLKPEEENEFKKDCQALEDIYFKWIEKYGWQPQQAAEFLPQDTMAECCMTGFVGDYKHFFDLRALGTTGVPHPTVKELCYPLYEDFKQRGYIE